MSVIVGDININIQDSGDDGVNDYLDLLAEESYIPAIYGCARPNQFGIGSCIDHIFVKTKLPLKCFNSMIWKVNITDHYPVLLTVENPQGKSDATSNICKKYRKIVNYKKLRTSLQDENWNNFCNRDLNVYELSKEFVSKICGYIHQ